jgi:hypothetical protein
LADVVDVDLTAPGTFRSAVPHAAFDALRAAGGIAWHDEPPVAGSLGDNPLLRFVDSAGFWAVTSHALVGEVDRDQERFSSEAGGTSMPSLPHALDLTRDPATRTSRSAPGRTSASAPIWPGWS